jgi:uncharacterized protein (DUF433 family)
MEEDWLSYDGVEAIPGKVSGVPVIKGTRVQAELVAECLDDGESVETIASTYAGLKPVDILRFKLSRDSHRMAALQR